uniref:Reverse transcriptase domain-containing protein n=1 Tax=Strongyloides papillosus TaxID=174720 RepID=A0A0N5BDL1_STREA
MEPSINDLLTWYWQIELKSKRCPSEKKRRELILESIPDELLEDYIADDLDEKDSSALLHVASQFVKRKWLLEPLNKRFEMIGQNITISSRTNPYTYALKKIKNSAELLGFDDDVDNMVIQRFINLLPRGVVGKENLIQPRDMILTNWLTYAEKLDENHSRFKQVASAATTTTKSHIVKMKEIMLPKTEAKSDGKAEVKTEVKSEVKSDTKQNRFSMGNPNGATKKFFIHEKESDDVSATLIIDSGSSHSYLCSNTFDKLSDDTKKMLEKNDVHEVEVGDNRIKTKTFGSILLNISIPFVDAFNIPIKFFLIKNCNHNFLSLDESAKLHALSKLETERLEAIDVEKKSNISDKVPTKIKNKLDKLVYLTNDDYSRPPTSVHTIRVSDDYNPQQLRPIPTPPRYRQFLEDFLNKEVEKGFLKKVDKITPEMEISRAHPRLVVMPMHINKFIICEQEQTGLTQKQIREEGVSLYKTVMDLKSAYKMQALDEQSQLKCIFTTDIGVFQPLRVNFGFKDSSSAFLKHLRTLLGDIPYVTWWMDDLYIYAPEKIHEDIVCTVLERLEKANMKISLEKCQFMKKKVEYLNMDMDHYVMQLP